IGLLLGAKGDSAFIGPGADEAYVEAELDLPEGFLDEEGLEALAELQPEDEPGLVVARRVFTDGRTRAYAWGRSVAREDLAAAVGAAEALAPEEGEGAAGLAAQAERSVAPLERLAPELERAGNELRDVELRLRETASELRGFLDALQAEPGRQEEVEAQLERI